MIGPQDDGVFPEEQEDLQQWWEKQKQGLVPVLFVIIGVILVLLVCVIVGVI